MGHGYISPETWGLIQEAKKRMRGRRIRPDSPDFAPHQCEPGDYYLASDGWRGMTPNGLCVWLKNHTVTENADGTIDVHPSILAGNGMGNKQWHGYLEDGTWREC